MPRAFNAKDIAERLRKIGITVTSIDVTDEPDLEDDSIQLAPPWHVQVGATYLILVKTSGGGEDFTLTFGTEHETLADLIAEILEKVPAR